MSFPNMRREEVARLVNRTREGDREAWGRLYLYYKRLVAGYANRYLPEDPSSVDDVVHDVFVQAWQKLHTLQNPRTFPSWIVTVTVRMCLNFRRRRRTTYPFVHLSEAVAENLACPTETPAEVAQRRDTVRVFWEAVGRLHPHHRSAIRTYCGEGRQDLHLSAALAGINYQSFKRRLSYARVELSGVLTGRHELVRQQMRDARNVAKRQLRRRKREGVVA